MSLVLSSSRYRAGVGGSRDTHMFQLTWVHHDSTMPWYYANGASTSGYTGPLGGIMFSGNIVLRT
jgi:hypothetical protein